MAYSELKRTDKWFLTYKWSKELTIIHKGKISRKNWWL